MANDINDKTFLKKVRELVNTKSPNSLTGYLTAEQIAQKLKVSVSTIEKSKRKLGLLKKTTDFYKNKVEDSYKKLSKTLKRLPTREEVAKAAGVFATTVDVHTKNKLPLGRKKVESQPKISEAFAKKQYEKLNWTPTRKTVGPKEEINKYLKDLEKRFKYPRTSVEYKNAVKAGEVLDNKSLSKKYKLPVNKIDLINSDLMKKEKLKYPEQTYEKQAKVFRRIDKERKLNIKTSSKAAIENQIKAAVKELGGKGKIDLAHRASLKANVLYGSDYLSESLGLDKDIVNQKYVKPFERELTKLYKEQKNLIKDLKPGKFSKEIQKQISDINLKIMDMSSKTDGALQGILMNEKTGNLGHVFGKNYSKILGMGMVDKAVKELTETDMDLIKAILPEQIKATKNISPILLNNYIKDIKNLPGGCAAIVKRAFKVGGSIESCEAIIRANPEAAAVKLNNAITATKGPLKDLKQDSQKMIRLFRGIEPNAQTQLYKASKNYPAMYDESLKGRFFFDNARDARYYARRQGSNTGRVLSVDVPENFVNIGKKMSERRKGPRLGNEIILPKKFVGKESLNIIETARARGEALTSKITFDNVKGAFVNRSTGDSVSSGALKAFAEETPIPVQAGTEDAFKPIKKNFLKTVGKTLAKVGAPLPTALLDGYFIGKQIQEDKPAVEIAKDPLNWLGLATMSTLTKVGGITNAGVATPGTMNTILRLGMSPAGITAISRLGYVGLAVSGALTAYDQYNKYQNEEGLIYNLFNDKAKAV